MLTSCGDPVHSGHAAYANLDATQSHSSVFDEMVFFNTLNVHQFNLATCLSENSRLEYMITHFTKLQDSLTLDKARLNGRINASTARIQSLQKIIPITKDSLTANGCKLIDVESSVDFLFLALKILAFCIVLSLAVFVVKILHAKEVL